MEENTWLWSPNQQCVQIQTFTPPNISCRKTQQVQERINVNEHVCLVPLQGETPLSYSKLRVC